MLDVAFDVWTVFLVGVLSPTTFTAKKRNPVATHGLREWLMLSYQTFITFPNLSILTLCSLYPFLSPYQFFVVLSNVCHLLAPCYLFNFYVIFSPYKCTYCTHHKHNSLSCLIVRTLSAPIYFSNPPGVFGHRAILTMGGIGPWLGVSS